MSSPARSAWRAAWSALISPTRAPPLGEGFAGSEGNSALIKNSSASGNVSVGNAGFGGGLVGGHQRHDREFLCQRRDHRTRDVAARRVRRRQRRRDHRIACDRQRDRRNKAMPAASSGLTSAGSSCHLRKATCRARGSRSLGGFVGLNFGDINQAYAIGAVTGGANGYLGGFVGLNLNAEITFGDRRRSAATRPNGTISQSYAFGRGHRQQRGRRRWLCRTQSWLARPGLWCRSRLGVPAHAVAASSARTIGRPRLPNLELRHTPSLGRPAPPPIRTGTCRPPP